MSTNSPVAGIDAKELMPPRQIARHRIRDLLQTMILRGERRPGSKLLQQKLAKELGVAQGVVREALLELQSCGLVETIDNRGIYVSSLSVEKLTEAFEVREIHEGLAARLCCDRVRRTDLRHLRQLAIATFELGREEKFQEMADSDREFHEQVMHLCGNSMLIRLAENYRLFGKIVRVNRDPVVVRDEHLAIINAMEAGQMDRAEAEMRAHIRAARNQLQKLVADGDFNLEWLIPSS